MTIRLLAASAFLLLATSPSLNAQDALSPDICGTEAADLMHQLDGVWSMSQGAGVAVGSATVPFKRMSGMIRGMVPTMLPPQDPVPLEMAYSDPFGFSLLSGQGQTMIMVPADAERAAEELQHQRERGGESAAREGPRCASGSLPVLVGTNTYELTEEYNEPSAREAGIPHLFDAFCTNNPIFEALVRAGIVSERFGAVYTLDRRTSVERCAPDGPPPPGVMRMTIILEYASRTSASGFIYFEGSFEGDQNIEFSPLAPLTMTR